MRVSLLTYNARAGDAIGNHVAEKLAFFLDSGADTRVFVESDHDLHPAIRPHCRLLAPQPHGDGWNFLADSDLVIVDYSQAYALLNLLPLLVGGRRRLVLDYHGVTPADFWTGSNAEMLVQGARMRGLVWCADAAIVHSRYARAELLKPTRFPAERTFSMGYAVNGGFWTSPGRHDFRARLGLGPCRILLFIGRLAPNKRVPMLVEALARLRDLDPPVHAIVIGDDTDVYQSEADRCRTRAEELGVLDRLHILGRLPVEQLREAYHAADVFVMPSRHEGFCLPVIEAMACGLPVVAARAAALPETVGDAGLTFAPDDVDDLVRRITQIIREPAAPEPAAPARALPGTTLACESGSSVRARIAIVSPRYGEDFAGGAERSLRTIAESLHAAGRQIEVFTTCARSDGDWKNDYREGTTQIGEIAVHRFRLNSGDNSLQSSSLMETLTERVGEFEAIIAGPYLAGLTVEIARAFPDKTLVLPCFHDEPAARQSESLDVYRKTAGLLYHSAEERAFAESELGVNHPGAHVIGTCMECLPGRGPSAARPAGRYVAYCGRYSNEKNLPLLLEFARDYARCYPDRFTFVFVGEGAVAIPREPWARDLGFVDEATKRDVLAGADALLQWSERESLSLVTLEAWAQATPVIANAGCAVLAGQVERSGGGAVAGDFAGFSRLLDDLWQHPEPWKQRGEAGRRYVQEHYVDRSAFTAKLLAALADVTRPLVERLKERGLRRAEQFGREAWRRRFASTLEPVLDLPPRELREQVEVTPRSETQTVSIATTAMLIPVRVTNRGSHPALTEGPARWVLRSYLAGEESRTWRAGGQETTLPGLLMPGQAQAAAIPLTVPAAPGTYHVAFHAEHARDDQGTRTSSAGSFNPSACHILTLKVTADASEATGCCGPLLEQARVALAEAHALQRLPDDYTDVSVGRFAALKRWLKRKLLGNFKRAYVDVLSRQQSDFNRRLLDAAQELADCCATLDHAALKPHGESASRPGPTDPEVLRHMLRSLTEQLVQTRERNEQLHMRLARLEAQLSRKDVA